MASSSSHISTDQAAEMSSQWQDGFIQPPSDMSPLGSVKVVFFPYSTMRFCLSSSWCLCVKQASKRGLSLLFFGANQEWESFFKNYKLSSQEHLVTHSRLWFIILLKCISFWQRLCILAEWLSKKNNNKKTGIRSNI